MTGAAGNVAGDGEKGYLARLEASWDSDRELIDKNYKKLARKYHPDKNPSADAVEEFQKITTAYHFVTDEEKLQNYLHLYTLRCYMSQTVPKKGSFLLPHYAFPLEKGKGQSKAKSERLLLVDFLALKLRIYKKEAPHKEFSISAIADIKPLSDPTKSPPFDACLTFKNNTPTPYYLRCRSREQYETLLAVFEKIARASECTLEAIGVAPNDEYAPPAALQKSKVLKKEGSMSWEQRFMVLGRNNILLFSSLDLKNLMNVIPLSCAKFVPQRGLTVFAIQLPYKKYSFRVANAEAGAAWRNAIAEAQGAVASHSRTGAQFSEFDLSTQLRRGPESSFIETDSVKTNIDGAPASAPILALPAPQLAPADLTFDGGWMQYSDDLGRVYFYNSVTNETTWQPPPGIEMMAGQQQESTEDSASQTAEERAEQASYFEDVQQSLAVQLAESREALLTAMKGVEKRLYKARKGVEAGRPVEDVLSLLGQLQQSYDKLQKCQTDFETFASERISDQSQFMDSQSAYLNGLQSHMLGDVDAQSTASKLFKKAAYVAETLHRNREAAL
ncbi:hypothetical protein AB1Y20_010641 [Prymnesium parvum]|uniref:WW domain-containing protein n=1 Tax=Prymnesium parvum TaxID=97485 RepID=A0AB34IQ99_PRYPA|mmetsp:Transcript_35056/g.87302  ORF Transcript_35056/g.87302 Transcript_35056/m.87302 type:complete len:559 (+) Transcript_35056:83-1759(+)|eukprot:CAMPEP_0195603436 /NCGR_PEP_ID=MMETSP0815-20121206/6125_1 /TAXON_ID=97485 /ORGANISM="Prymnesium parvum, Strain Texoma1" /LENGTH=558 /DNA_ID=CAMNT_0040743059 /DNA_START=25 /DNA_END=1701 /DNA_ORIENTATION=+